MSNWFENSYRNLFFDFHTHSSVRKVAGDLDADAWMKEVRDMGAEAVSVFAVDAFGWRFYRKGEAGWVHPGLPEDLDLLGELTAAAHRHQIKAIAYFNTVESEAVALHRPEYRELDASRQPKSDYEIYEGMVICWLGPAFQEIFLPQVEEIARNYDIDALFFDGTYAHGPCYCPDCTANYRADTGHDLPTGEDVQNWMRWVTWAESRYEAIRGALIDAVKRHRPDALVCFNWFATTRRPALIDRRADRFLSLDLHPQAQLADASLQARAWTAGDVPFTCQNTLFLDWWGDWGIKPQVALAQECASVLANGGRIFTGFQLLPDHSLLPSARAALTEMMRFVGERVGSVEHSRPVRDIAVLHPSTSYDAKDPRTFDDADLADEQPVGRYQLGLPEVFPDEGPVRGAHRMLFELGYDYHVVTEDVLLEHLSEYRLVILPGMRHLSEQFFAALQGWVEAGGSLLITDERTRLDERLRDLLLGLAGVRAAAPYPHDHAYLAAEGEEPFLVRSSFLPAEPGEGTESIAALTGIYLRDDGRPLLKTSPPGGPTGSSAATLRRVGAGRVAYYAFEPFDAYRSSNQWRLRDHVGAVLERLLPEPAVRVRGTDGVEVTRRERGTETLVHLVNHTGYASREWGAWGTSTEVVPRSQVQVALRFEGDPEEVTDGLTGTPLRWTRTEGTLRVAVPTLDIHTCIRIESASSATRG